MRFARLAAPATFVLALLAPPLAAEAQSAGKVYRIALVHPNARVAGMTEVKNPYFKVLFSELRRLGYVEGQNLVVERRSGYGRPARFPEFAREVVQLQPDLILLFSSRLAHAFKAATTTIPLVGITGDPILDKLVTSVARPGGNLTGFSTDTDESALGKPLELLKGVVPNVTLSAPTTQDWGPVRPSRRKSVVRQPPWDPTEQGLYIRPLEAEAGDREQDRPQSMSGAALWVRDNLPRGKEDAHASILAHADLPRPVVHVWRRGLSQSSEQSGIRDRRLH